MASKRRNFYNSGPFYLTAVDWTNLQHRRIVAASLVHGTYCMQYDRQKKLQGHLDLALAPPWWEFFKFQPVKELYDEHDHSIFGAVFKSTFTPSYSNPPQYVVAFRGTIFKKHTWKQDLKLDFHLMQNELPQSTRVQLAIQAVQNIVSEARHANIWLAGHSLGSAIALAVGKNMVKKEGCFIEAYLFNLPFVSVPIELLKNENLKHEFRFAISVTKALAVVILRSQYQRSQIDHSFNALSGWIPYLFVNPSDPICSEYIGYFEHRENMVEVGFENIARHATQNSVRSLIFGGTGTDSEPSHLLPSAYLTINVIPKLKQAHGKWWGKLKLADEIHQWWGKLKQAHGIHQWWEQNSNCQVLHQYSCVDRIGSGTEVLHFSPNLKLVKD